MALLHPRVSPPALRVAASSRKCAGNWHSARPAAQAGTKHRRWLRWDTPEPPWSREARPRRPVRFAPNALKQPAHRMRPLPAPELQSQGTWRVASQVDLSAKVKRTGSAQYDTCLIDSAAEFTATRGGLKSVKFSFAESCGPERSETRVHRTRDGILRNAHSWREEARDKIVISRFA